MLISDIGLISGSNSTGSLIFFSGKDILSIQSTDKNSLSFNLRQEGSDKIDLLFITASGNDAKVGIGTTDPKSYLDVRGNTGTETADIVLRTAKPSNAKVSADDESGRISFVIESSSFTDGRTKNQFIKSGSSAEIFSRIIGEHAGAVYGNLIFSVNDSSSPLDSTEALTIGQGSIGGYSGVGLVISGNMELANLIPIFTIADTTTGNQNARLGAPNSPGSDWCNLELRRSGTNKIQLLGQDGSISGSGEVIGATGSFDIIEGGTF